MKRNKFIAFLLVMLFITQSVFAQTPGVPAYPASLDTRVSFLEATNNAHSTINDIAGISNVATSVTLANANAFPSTGELTIDNEIIYYTTKVGNVISGLVRGREGTIATSHSFSTIVSLKITAQYHNGQSDGLMALQAKLGIGAGNAADAASGTFLRKGSTTTTWSAIQTSDLPTIGIGQGGTGLTTYAQGDLIYASATNTLAKLTKDTNATRYLSNTGTSNNPAWAQISLTNGVTGTLPVTNGGLGAATFTSNGVLFGNGTSPIQVTAAGGTNTLLIGGGAPSFSATPTTDRFTVNPATPSYDLILNTFAVGFSFGNGTPGTPVSYNVPVSKQLSGILSTANNSGAGKLFLIEFYGSATGATQDANEPIRGIVGRVVNTGTSSPGKTTAVRVGVTAGTGNISQLIGVDADITIDTLTNNLSSVFGATIAGTADDRASGYVLYNSGGARVLMGFGNFSAMKFQGAAFQAFMATGSDTNARAFRLYNNGGSEIAYIGKSGELSTGLAGTQSGSLLIGGGTSGTISILPQAAAGTYNFNLPTTAGSSGQPLLSGGGGASPMTFGSLSQANVSNLGLVMIQTQVADGTTTVIDFTAGVLTDTYDSYVLIIDASPETDDVEAWLRIGTGGTPTYQTSGYTWGLEALIVGVQNLYGSAIGGSTARLLMSEEASAGTKVGNASGEGWRGEIRFSNPEASTFCDIYYDAQYSRATAGQSVRIAGGGRYDVQGAVTGIRFMFSSGDIAAGSRFTLYGYRKS